LYALCLAVGFPTPSSQYQATLLWNIRARTVPKGRVATYSEHSGEADLHTDSQSFPQPEEYLALYVDHAARCGGGVSLFLSTDTLHEALKATTEGREAIEILSTRQFPFYISAGEAGARNSGAVTLAPIFGQRLTIRFRRDVLEKGFSARPDLDTPAARHAFELLLDVLVRQVPVVEYLLPDGAITLCDNHRMLHGRTGFKDQQRHLLRVRMSAQPVAVHIASFLQGKDSFAQAVLS
jgi:alpha-ketoglutarate-dependent taurine dioxygenase